LRTPKRRINLHSEPPQAPRRLEDLSLAEILRLFIPVFAAKEPEPRAIGWKICVLDRGFVYVGIVTIAGETVTIEHAHNVRYWGTTAGLGELALNNGPLPQTKLDRAGIVTCTLNAIMHFIDTQEGTWPR
jgi:hypothetical protein